METQNQNLSAEQDADLRRLEGMAAAGDPQPMAEEAAGSAAPVVDPAQAWAEIPALVGSVLAMALPEVKTFYTPDACLAWGEKMVPVADELGWDVSEVMGPKLALAVATAPFIMGPVMIVKAKRAAAEQATKEKAEPAKIEGGQKSVTFGAAR